MLSSRSLTLSLRELDPLKSHQCIVVIVKLAINRNATRKENEKAACASKSKRGGLGAEGKEKASDRQLAADVKRRQQLSDRVLLEGSRADDMLHAALASD